MSKPESKSKSNSPGFNKGWRFLNRDGTFNVDRQGLRRSALSDLYHGMLSATWPKFIALMLLAYLSVNFIFGLLYFAAGPEALEGLRHAEGWGRFWESYFFSVQTLATIGYGRLSPNTFFANSVMTLEAFVGMTAFAIWAGLAFARFSRPTAKVLFSRNALITVMDGQLCFIFRMANARLNQIIEAGINVVCARTETTQEGETFRNLYDLKLERALSPMFALTWTVVHPIDEASPFYGKSAKDLESSQTEILVSLTGIDDTLSQTIHTRFSYVGADILWNARFEDMLTIRSDKRLTVNLEKINDVKIVTALSASQLNG